MSRKHKKRTSTITRAQGVGQPSGSIVLPTHIVQQMLLQQHYSQMSQIKNKGGQGDALFTPGIPLETQPGTAPSGIPIVYKFPLAYNTFGVDRSLGSPDRPSFEQLRSLAELCDAINLCERAWYDMVPRMKHKINLHPRAIAQGAEEKQFQKEMDYFYEWFSHPGYNKKEDIHTWLRRSLREQTQIDELYIHKHKNRGGGLYSLDVMAGDIFKPLLDDWGRIPIPPLPAYQEYPWGIPGMQFTTDEMLHYQESPAANRPYGFSRVERVMMRVNQLLRKQNRDLAMFTEGNIPAAIGEVPGDTQWTPDQIDAFEQAWNALIAGSPQQQVRVRFTMPGMKITPLDNGQIMTDFDLFLLRMTAGCYGLSVGDLSFTDNANYSTSDIQQNVLYRRTVEPLAMIYANMLTGVMQHDFDPDLHGDLFVLSFSAFEEKEDLQAMVAAYSQAAQSGLIGITDATDLLKFPQPKDAPYIGRVMLSKDGPLFLDDMASDDLRQAAVKAKLAGFEMAANPPEPAPPGGAAPASSNSSSQTNSKSSSSPKQSSQDDDEEEQPTKQSSKQPQKKTAKRDTMVEFERLLAEINRRLREEEEDDSSTSQETQTTERDTTGIRGGDGQVAARTATATVATDAPDEAAKREVSAEYRKWRGRAIDDVKAGRAFRGFTTTLIPPAVHEAISAQLIQCKTPDDVRTVFELARYNPNHDAHNGQFASGSGGAGEEVDQPTDKMPAIKVPKPSTGEKRGPGQATTQYATAQTTASSPPHGVLRQHMQDLESAWREKLTEDEKFAVFQYSSQDYRPMNRALREGTVSALSQDMQQGIEGTLSALQKSRLPEAIVVHRGLPDDSGKRWEFFRAAQGQTYTDPAFGSSSLSQDVAARYAGADYGPYGVLMHIHLPQGTRGAYVAQTSGVSGEEEFLIAPNASYKVLKAYTDNKGQRHVDLGAALPKIERKRFMAEQPSKTNPNDAEKGAKYADKFNVHPQSVVWDDPTLKIAWEELQASEQR